MVTVDATWVLHGLAGGVIIGLASGMLLLVSGRIAGITGIIGGVLVPTPGEWSWRLAFIGGMLAGGAVVLWFAPVAFAVTVPRSLGLFALGGALVGVGTRMANGCTSGHGVCGVGRLSPRSLVAAAVFTTCGALAVAALRML